RRGGLRHRDRSADRRGLCRVQGPHRGRWAAGVGVTICAWPWARSSKPPLPRQVFVGRSSRMLARTTNPMRNANQFKLGLFSINADGGPAFTKVANRWRADWSEIETLAHIADAAGLEFILPIARWKGYGGETKVRAASFETLTHAAAVAAITRRIAIFSTVHVPLVHPVFAAKALMTIDHVSRGPAGLNILCSC